MRQLRKPVPVQDLLKEATAKSAARYLFIRRLSLWLNIHTQTGFVKKISIIRNVSTAMM